MTSQFDVAVATTSDPRAARPGDVYVSPEELAGFKDLFNAVILNPDRPDWPAAVQDFKDFIAGYSEDEKPQPGIALTFLRKSEISITAHQLSILTKAFQENAKVSGLKPAFEETDIINRFTIQQSASAFFLRTGIYPQDQKGLILDGPLADGTRRWEDIDARLQRADIPGTGATCLRDFLITQGLGHGNCKSTLTEDFIAEHMWAYFQKHRKFPSDDSGLVEGLVGETWKNWYAALRGIKKPDNTYKPIRGLPCNSSFDKISIKKGWCLGDLTEDIIAEYMWKHFDRHGKFPGQNSGTVDGLPGENWGAWHAALIGELQNDGSYKPLRGLKETGSSLRKICIKKGWCLGDLTEEIIAERMWAYYKKNGKFPSQSSGPIDGLPGENWGSWNAALRGKKQPGGGIKPLRGLPGGSSLMKFRQSEFFQDYIRRKQAEALPGAPAPEIA